MNKRTGLIICIVLFLMGGGFAAVLYSHRKPSVSSSIPAQTSANNSPASVDGANITVTGKIECLPHKDTSGPVDMMCAIGMQADDGTHYALSSDDPTLVGSVPTGQRVQVTGVFTSHASQYNSPGVIKITSLRRL